MVDVQYFNGIKFVKRTDDYYGYNTNGKTLLMHRYVWEYYNGEIPRGYIIHHKDRNKSNNTIDNLECIENKTHSTYHGRNKTPEQLAKDRENLNKARIKAVEWHKSEEGREVSRQNAYKLIERGVLNPLTSYTCDNCGKEFIAIKRSAKHKFCCGACEQYYRRHNGLNDIIKVCVICGKEFTADKYGRTQTCSRSCGMKLAHLNRTGNWKDKKNVEIVVDDNNIDGGLF